MLTLKLLKTQFYKLKIKLDFTDVFKKTTNNSSYLDIHIMGSMNVIS